jgi:hypothetical protein
MSNNNLNDLASKLEKIRISNDAEVNKPGALSTHHLRTVPSTSVSRSESKQQAKKANRTLRFKKDSPRRGKTVKKVSDRERKLLERRRESHKRAVEEKKETALAKRRQTIARKEKEKEAKKGSTNATMEAPKVSQGVKKIVKTLRFKNNSPRRGKSVKASSTQKKIMERRRESVKVAAEERKKEATAKRRETAMKRKAAEEEAAAKSMVSGKTRSEAKKAKEQESQMGSE